MARFAAKRDPRRGTALGALHSDLIVWGRGSAPSKPSAALPPHSQPSPSHHSNRGSFSEKSGLRLATKHRRNVFAIELFPIALKCRLPYLPDSPRRMRHAIFHAAPIELCRISPVVLGTKRVNRALARQFRIAIGFKIDLVPALPAPPSVCHPQTIIANRANLVRHGESNIIFVVEPAGNECGRPARNHLVYEHHTSPDFASR